MFLDFKLGLLWAFLIGILFHHPLTLGWFLGGILFAFLPDIDFWVEYAQRGTVGGKFLGAHRTLLHNPLTLVPFIIFIGVFFGPAWMTLAAFGIIGHFIHDSLGMGFGVRWLWPFSARFYKVFSDREGNIYYDLAHLKPISWTQEEVQKVIQEKGNDNWIQEDIAYAKRNAASILLKLLFFILTLLFIRLIFSNFFA